MGKTFSTGLLTDGIAQDSSNNIGIGGAVNASYKLTVTGTTLTTGAATFSSTITSQVNGSTFGTASATGRAVIIQAGSTNQAIMFKNAAGGDGTLFVDGTSTTLDYNFNTYSVGNALVIKNSGNIGIGTSSPTGKLMVYQGSAGNVFTSLVSPQGGSTQVGINFAPSMTDSEFASNPAQASIYATDSNYGANIIFANKTTGAVGNSLTERMRITSGGNVMIGTSTDQGVKLYVGGTFTADTTLASGYAHTLSNKSYAAGANGLFVDLYSASSSSYALAVRTNDGNSYPLRVRADGLITTGTTGTAPYNFDPGGRVMYVNSLGQIGSTSSTRESKIHINPITNVDYINQLNPVSFYHRIQDTETRSYTDEYFDEIKYGFIADEVEKVNLDLVFYNEQEDGTKKLAGVEYMSMIAMLVKGYQELSAKVTALENKIN